MDTSTVLSLFSILVSIVFFITALYFSNKSDKTLASIQAKIDVQHDRFMDMLQQAHANFNNYAMQAQVNNNEYTTNVMKMLLQAKVRRGELSNEEAKDFEEELKEAIKVQLLPSPDPTSILSKQSKLGK